MKTKLLPLLLFSMFNFISPADADLKDGLVAYWSFDDCTARDGSGNGHDGTLNGNPQCVEGAKGKAFSFDGSHDFIEIPYQQANLAAYSISSWVKISTNENGGVIAQSRGDNSKGGMSPILWVGDTNFVGSDIFSFTIASDFINTGVKASATLVKDGVWHHIVGVWTSQIGSKIEPTQFQLYLDGLRITTLDEKAFGANIQSPITGNGNLLLGRYAAWNSFFQGAMDQVRIYNRALTEAEVAELYNPNNPIQSINAVDLSTTLSQSSNRVKINENLTYTAAVINNGTGTANNSLLKIYLPPRNVSIVSMPSDCVTTGKSLTCSLGNLAAGANASRAITVNYIKSGGASVGALALTDSEDMNSDNNFSRVVTAIKK